MSYRVRRKFTGSKFSVDGQICKVFLEPKCKYRDDFYLWNVGFAVGKSNRQINDWYQGRKNKRARSLQGKIVGRSGTKILRKAYEEVFKLRWKIEPGDAICIACTSGKPDQQFRVFWRWLGRHSDIVGNFDTRNYYWYRPPNPTDPVWNHFNIRGLIPANPLIETTGSVYFDCFSVLPKVQDSLLSTEQITDLLFPVSTTGPFLEMPT
tara:strand:- start:801 stop:1424 length:624 start_codon:yes stop_codon:yes gene_type:complete